MASSVPEASPAATRLQYSVSKWPGCSRNACDMDEPASILFLMSIMRREKRALLWPRATISNDCRRGTPAFSIVASWRVKNVMSFSLTLRPPRNVCRLILTMRMPWRRRLVVTTVSDAAFDSPRTWRLLRSMPSQRNVNSLTSRRAMRWLRWPWFVILDDDGRRRHSLVIASISSSDVMPDLTLSRPDWRKVAYAFLLRLLGDVERVAVAHDDLPHVVGDRHHLVDADRAPCSRCPCNGRSRPDRTAATSRRDPPA